MCYKKYSQSNRKSAILIQVQALSVHTPGVSSSIVPINNHQFKTIILPLYILCNVWAWGWPELQLSQQKPNWH